MFRFIRAYTWLCMSVLAPAVANAETTPSGAIWSFEQISDPVHKGGSIANAQYSTILDGGERSVAMVRCWTATDLLDIRFQPGAEATDLTGDVSWRFDRARQTSGRWRVTAMGNGIVVPDGLLRTFVRSMREARSLELRLKTGTGSELELVVPLKGSASPIGKVAAACGG